MEKELAEEARRKYGYVPPQEGDNVHTQPTIKPMATRYFRADWIPYEEMVDILNGKKDPIYHQSVNYSKKKKTRRLQGTQWYENNWQWLPTCIPLGQPGGLYKCSLCGKEEAARDIEKHYKRCLITHDSAIRACEGVKDKVDEWEGKCTEKGGLSQVHRSVGSCFSTLGVDVQAKMEPRSYIISGKEINSTIS